MSVISEKQLVRMLDAHAKNTCSNYGADGLCYHKDKKCALRRADEEFSNRGITCRWFREAVLPSDKELEQFYEGWKQKEITRREEKRGGISQDSTPLVKSIDLCVGCRTPMIVKSNRQKYCEKCSKINRLRREASRLRTLRSNQG